MLRILRRRRRDLLCVEFVEEVTDYLEGSMDARQRAPRGPPERLRRAVSVTSRADPHHDRTHWPSHRGRRRSAPKPAGPLAVFSQYRSGS